MLKPFFLLLLFLACSPAETPLTKAQVQEGIYPEPASGDKLVSATESSGRVVGYGDPIDQGRYL